MPKKVRPAWHKLSVRRVVVKISKETAQYVERSDSHDECRDCRHFEVIAKNHCEAVTGEINPGGWCKLFSRKSRLAEAMKGAK